MSLPTKWNGTFSVLHFAIHLGNYTKRCRFLYFLGEYRTDAFSVWERGRYSPEVSARQSGSRNIHLHHQECNVQRAPRFYFNARIRAYAPVDNTRTAFSARCRTAVAALGGAARFPQISRKERGIILSLLHGALSEFSRGVFREKSRNSS